MVHFASAHLYKFVTRSRGFFPRTTGAERIRGYKIVKDTCSILNHADKIEERLGITLEFSTRKD
jgi:hypothetical protein